MNDRLALTKDRYGTDAAAYRELWAPVLLPYVRDLLPALDLNDATRVLEAATGTGSLLPYLRESAPKAQICAIDLAHGMIRSADQEYVRAVMDVQHLAFSDGSFDAALIAFALQHVPDPSLAFISLSRVLKKGGRLGAITWGVNASFRAADVWGEELDDAGAEVVPSIASPEKVDHIDKLYAWSGDAGLKPETTWEVAGRYQMTPETFLLRFTSLGLNRLRYESLDKTERQRFLSRLKPKLLGMSDDDLAEPMNMIYFVARA